MGKGDTARPSSISKEKYDANYEAAFGKKELPQWEDAPRIGEGDQDAGGGVSPNKDEDQDVHESDTPTETGGSPTKEGSPWTGRCPICGGDTWPRKGFHFDHERFCSACEWSGEIK